MQDEQVGIAMLACSRLKTFERFVTLTFSGFRYMVALDVIHCRLFQSVEISFRVPENVYGALTDGLFEIYDGHVGQSDDVVRSLDYKKIIDHFAV